MKHQITVLALLLLLTTAAHSQKWLTDVGYDYEDDGGMYFGYVNQQIELTNGELHEYWRGVWNGDQNKRLHGFVMGAMGQTNWFYGLGLYSGFGLEMFVSNAATPDDAFSLYMELTINVPIHLAFRLPVTSDASLGFHTGIGTTLSYIAYYIDTRGYFPDHSVLGDDGRVKFYNFTYDFAVYAQYKNFRLELQWSTGLNDHKLAYDGSFITRRNKFAIGTTIFFN